MRGIILLLIAFPLFSQDKESLLKSIETASEKDRIHLWKIVAEEEEKSLRLTDAINAYKQSNVWARKGDDLSTISLNYLEIAELYFRIGDKDEALIYLRLHGFVKELIAKKDVANVAIRLNNLHLLETKALEEQLQNKEKQNSILKKDNNRSRKVGLWTQIILGLTLIALVIVSYIYYQGIDIFSERLSHQMK